MKASLHVASALIAAGTALAAALYCVVDGVLFKPLPGRNTKELYVVGRPPASGTDRVRTVTVQEFLAIQEVSSGEAYAFTTGLTADRPAPEPFRAVQISPEFTRVSGVTTVAGRPLRPDDAYIDVGVPALISAALWRSRYGGTQRVFEEPLILNGLEIRIVGVLPEGFDLPSGANLWLPLRLRSGPRAINFAYLTCVVRLTDTTRVNLSAFADLELQQLRARLPTTGAVSSGLLLAVVVSAVLTGWWTVVITQVARWSAALHHAAIRMALGASPLQASISELRDSLRVFGLSQILALVLTPGALRAVVAALPADQTVGQPIGIDARTMTFLAALACITACVVVAVPVVVVRLHLMRSLSGCLDAGLQAGTALGRRMAPAIVLIVAGNVIAWTLVLAVLRAHAAAATFSPGIAADDLMRITIKGSNARQADETVHAQLAAALTAQAWARQVAGGELPIDPGSLLSTVSAAAPRDPKSMGYPVVERWVDEQYFRASGLRMVEGGWSFGSNRDTRSVVVARHVAQSAGLRVGERVFLGGLPFFLTGIAADTYSHGPDSVPDANVYVPAPRPGSSWIIRTTGSSRNYDSAARRLVYPYLGAYQQIEVVHVREVVTRRLAPFAATTRLLLVVAVASLLLGTVGVAAAQRDSTMRRRRELAIRASLGASTEGLRRLVVRPAVSATVLGGLLGLIGVAVARAFLGSVWLLPRLQLGIGIAAFALVALVILAVAYIVDPLSETSVADVSRSLADAGRHGSP